MSARHSFPGSYSSSTNARFVIGGIQEPVPVAPTVPVVTSFTISGQVTESGTGKQNVVVFFPSVGSIATDSDGDYAYTVPRNWIGVVTPVYSGGTFTPASRSYAAVISSWSSQDYVYSGTGGFGAQPVIPTIHVGGTVTDGDNSNAPLSGIPVSIIFDSNPTQTYLTNSNGVYHTYFPLGAYANGTITATRSAGTTTPASYTVSLPSDQLAKNFVFAGTGGFGAQPTPSPVLLSGTFRDWVDGYPALSSGWEITFSNRSPVSTDSRGVWEAYVNNSYTGTVGWTSDGYGTITPSNYSLVSQTSNQGNLNFDYYGPVYTLGGTIYDNSTSSPWDAQNVVVTSIGTLTTDSEGRYQFSAPWNYQGSITPSIPSYGSLSPTNSYYVNLPTQDNLGYIFQYWYNPPGTLCQVPGDNIAPVASGLTEIGRNVIDSDQHLLWVIDDSGSNVAYYDVVYGTMAGTVVTSGTLGAIVYEPTTKKVVVSDDQNSRIHVIDAASKTLEQSWLYASDQGPIAPAYHSLAVGSAGTVFAAAINYAQPSAGAYIYGYDLNNMSIASRHGLSVATRAITWSPVLQRLVVMTPGLSTRAFQLYDPTTGIFQDSVLVNNTANSYEMHYLAETGDVLWGNGANVRVLDVDTSGTDATVIKTLTGTPTRAASVTTDTCHDRLFVANTNNAIYEYTLDGSYNLFNIYDVDVSPTGLAHSERTNLVYYGDFSDQTIRSIQATTVGTNVEQARWTVLNTPGPESRLSGTPASTMLDITSAGNETESFTSSEISLRTAIINFGAPYGYKITSVYSLATDSQGTIDAEGQSYFSLLQVGGGSSVSDTLASNGTIASTGTEIGTFATGYTRLTFSAAVDLGGNFLADPCELYGHVRNNVTIVPLG